MQAVFDFLRKFSSESGQECSSIFFEYNFNCNNLFAFSDKMEDDNFIKNKIKFKI